MSSGPQWILNNIKSLVDGKLFSFFNAFLARVKNKYKIVYSTMVVCSESNVLEVSNTDDIIKGFASQKERKFFFYLNNIFIFCIKKKQEINL
jgi:hypothetical protein